MAFVAGLLCQFRSGDCNLGAFTFLERGSGMVEASMILVQLVVVSLMLGGAIRTSMRKRRRQCASRTAQS